MKEATFKKILNNYTKGTASEDERTIVEDFGEHFIKKNKTTSFKSYQHKEQLQIDSYRSIKKKIATKQPSWYKIAASIIITLGVGLSAWFTFNTSEKVLYTTIATSNNEIKTIVLADSSVVTLNKNSSISFPEEFKKNTRNVVLKGEAFFKISKDKNRPFTVMTNTITTTVLGTQFNINMKNEEIAVSLVEGSVDVHGLGTSKILKPKEQIHFNLKDSIVQTKKFDPKEELIWMAKNLSFNNDKLIDIIQLLEKKFNVAIELESGLDEVRITGMFEDKRLSSILLAITKTANLEFKKTTKNQILIFKPIPIDEK